MLLYVLRRIHASRIYVFFIVGVSVVLLGAGLSFFYSGRQPAIVSLDVGISLMHFVLPFLIAFQLQELVVREFEGKLYVSSMTYPVSRSKWLLLRAVAILCFSCFSLSLCFLFLCQFVGLLEDFSPSGSMPVFGVNSLVVLFFFMLEVFVILSFGVFLSVVVSSSQMLLVSLLSFFVLARSFSSVFQMVSLDSELVFGVDGYVSALSLIYYVLPDISQIDVREIVLYGYFSFLPDDVLFLILKNLIYGFSFLFFSVFVIQRKRFK